MDFKDFSERMKKARQSDAPEQQSYTYDYNESYRLRGKMLGVLIRDARVAAARTVDDIARLLNLAPDVIESWEYGDTMPDLPQLEMLAYYLDVPISHFWSQNALEKDPTRQPNAQEQFRQLRHRMIGALMQQAREDVQLSLENIAESSNIPVEQLREYELGNDPIPMNVLPVLSDLVNKNMDYWLEADSYIGELLRTREEWKKFTDLDDEIREFASNPTNMAFIKIAITFSKMPTEQIRKAAEGLLEISM